MYFRELQLLLLVSNKNLFNLGTLKDPKGIYKGTFREGKKHGKGEYKFVNDSRYKGEY